MEIDWLKLGKLHHTIPCDVAEGGHYKTRCSSRNTTQQKQSGHTVCLILKLHLVLCVQCSIVCRPYDEILIRVLWDIVCLHSDIFSSTGTLHYNVWFQKISIPPPPPWKVFFLVCTPLPPLWKLQFTGSSIILVLPPSLPLGISIPSVGEVWIFPTHFSISLPYQHGEDN